MTYPQQVLQVGDIFRADFRTSQQADAENTRIQKDLGFQFRYQPARLAIALSLSDPTLPPPSETGGKPIKGDTLFGQDEADLVSWISMTVEHSGTKDLSRKELQEQIAAHWARGIPRLAAVFEKGAAIEEVVMKIVGNRF